MRAEAVEERDRRSAGQRASDGSEHEKRHPRHQRDDDSQSYETGAPGGQSKRPSETVKRTSLEHLEIVPEVAWILVRHWQLHEGRHILPAFMLQKRGRNVGLSRRATTQGREANANRQ